MARREIVTEDEMDAALERGRQHMASEALAHKVSYDPVGEIYAIGDSTTAVSPNPLPSPFMSLTGRALTAYSETIAAAIAPPFPAKGVDTKVWPSTNTAHRVTLPATTSHRLRHPYSLAKPTPRLHIGPSEM